MKSNAICIRTPKIKYFGTNLTKHVQDLDKEDYKTLMSKTKAELNKWRSLPHSQTGRQHYRDVNSSQLTL